MREKGSFDGINEDLMGLMKNYKEVALFRAPNKD